MCDARTATIAAVCAWLKEDVWKLPGRKQVKVVLKEKSVLEQKEDEGDSAMYAINHATAAFGAKRAQDRHALRVMVKDWEREQ